MGIAEGSGEKIIQDSVHRPPRALELGILCTAEESDLFRALQ